MYQDEGFLAWISFYYPNTDISQFTESHLQSIYDWWLNEGSPSPPTPEIEYTPEQIAEYDAYLEFLGTPEGVGFPTPTDIEDYLANKDAWQDWMAHPPEEKDAYELYQAYRVLYRDPQDWYAKTIEDFLANIDVAYEQIEEWRGEALREYQEYRDYASYRDIGTFVYQNLDDFILNYEDAQAQLAIWQTEYGEQEAEGEEWDAYNEWQREQAEYAAQERYREQPRYDPAFYEEMEALQGESVYYQDWMKRMYPELRARFEATQPAEIGYPTREEARAAAAQTEQEWETWLGGQQKGLVQEFYGQPPYERGERPAYYAPRLRSVSYA